MPLKVLAVVTVAICDLCGHTVGHTSTTNPDVATAASARVELARGGWMFAGVDEPLQDTTGRLVDAICPRCAPLFKTVRSAMTG